MFWFIHCWFIYLNKVYFTWNQHHRVPIANRTVFCHVSGNFVSNAASSIAVSDTAYQPAFFYFPIYRHVALLRVVCVKCHSHERLCSETLLIWQNDYFPIKREINELWVISIPWCLSNPLLVFTVVTDGLRFNDLIPLEAEDNDSFQNAS